MPFPAHTEINTALRNPSSAFVHRDLAPAVLDDPKSSPICDSGRYAVVSKVRLAGKSWALRIPIAVWADSTVRYRMINERVGPTSKAFVDCKLLSNAIRVPLPNGPLYDVVVMEWIEGQNLNNFLRSACESKNSQAIGQVRECLKDLCLELQDLQITHGDLSPMNILVTETRGQHVVKLVDYDFVSHPSLPFRTTLPASPTRHPRRPITSDPFSDLFVFQIYDLVLRALQLEPTLWDDLDDYNDQTLFISFCDPTPESLRNLEVLRRVVPSETSAIETIANAPYFDTPRPAREMPVNVEILPASDWKRLREMSGQLAAITGFVKSVSGANVELVSPSRLNRSSSVVAAYARRPVQTPNRGDRVVAYGEVRVVGRTISISSSDIKVIDPTDESNDRLNTSLRKHVSGTLERIRDLFNKRPPLQNPTGTKPRRTTRTRGDSRSEARSKKTESTQDRPVIR